MNDILVVDDNPVLLSLLSEIFMGAAIPPVQHAMVSKHWQ
jgi:CheY-like chemotaxis protein